MRFGELWYSTEGKSELLTVDLCYSMARPAPKRESLVASAVAAGDAVADPLLLLPSALYSTFCSLA